MLSAEIDHRRSPGSHRTRGRSRRSHSGVATSDVGREEAGPRAGECWPEVDLRPLGDLGSDGDTGAGREVVER